MQNRNDKGVDLRLTHIKSAQLISNFNGQTRQTGVVYYNSNFQSDDGTINNISYSKAAHSELKPRSKRKSKFFSSKSLSQLVSKRLFFINSNNQKQSPASKQVKNSSQESKLITTRSLPNYETIVQKSHVHRIRSDDRMNFDPMHDVNLPRHSSSNSFASNGLDSSIDEANIIFSPIVDRPVDLSMMPMDLEVVGPQITTDEAATAEDKPVSGGRTDAKQDSTKAAFRPFKSTKLALRDVKNSIGLRLNAKRNSRAFSRLTNELATPQTSTKLYSPFNIYLDSAGSAGDVNSKRNSSLKRRESELNENMDISLEMISEREHAESKPLESELEAEIPAAKRRFGLRSRSKHLTEAGSKFAFDSPTGRLRGTVREVEQFQQCIDDISEVIKSRQP